MFVFNLPPVDAGDYALNGKKLDETNHGVNEGSVILKCFIYNEV